MGGAGTRRAGTRRADTSWANTRANEVGTGSTAMPRGSTEATVGRSSTNNSSRRRVFRGRGRGGCSSIATSSEERITAPECGGATSRRGHRATLAVDASESAWAEEQTKICQRVQELIELAELRQTMAS